MSRVWKLDRSQYGDDGLLSLFRGDDWSVFGTVVDRVNGYETLVDLSGLAVTGYFPSASGGPDLPALAVTGSCGVLTVSLPAASTPLVLDSTGGIPLYVVTQDRSGRLVTVPTRDEGVVIIDRGLPSP